MLGRSNCRYGARNNPDTFAPPSRGRSPRLGGAKVSGLFLAPYRQFDLASHPWHRGGLATQPTLSRANPPSVSGSFSGSQGSVPRSSEPTRTPPFATTTVSPDATGP